MHANKSNSLARVGADNFQLRGREVIGSGNIYAGFDVIKADVWVLVALPVPDVVVMSSEWVISRTQPNTYQMRRFRRNICARGRPERRIGRTCCRLSNVWWWALREFEGTQDLLTSAPTEDATELAAVCAAERVRVWNSLGADRESCDMRPGSHISTRQAVGVYISPPFYAD